MTEIFALREDPDTMRASVCALLSGRRLHVSEYVALWNEACTVMAGFDDTLVDVLAEMLRMYDRQRAMHECITHHLPDLVYALRGDTANAKIVPLLVRGLAKLTWLHEVVMRWCIERLEASYPDAWTAGLTCTQLTMSVTMPLMEWVEATGSKKIAAKLLHMAVRAGDVAAFDRAASVWRRP